MSVFIIAEAGVNHAGDIGRALDMVDAASASGSDAIKFQTFNAELLAGPSATKAAYQARETGEGNQLDMLRALELTEDDHRRLHARCAERGIEFMSTPFDEHAADFLVNLGMKRIKIPSGEIVNHELLAHFARFDLPLIMSTGMATLDEVTEAVGVIRDTRVAYNLKDPLEAMLTILHCTSNYPAAVVDVNLRAMDTIAASTGLPVGYSDHTLGTAVSVAAVARGATVIEKHFTLDRTLPGPDHRASLELPELTEMVAAIRDVSACLGSPKKQPSADEIAVRAVARRSVCAARNLAVGTILSDGDTVLVRPGTGIAPKFRRELAGRTIIRPLQAGEPIVWDDLA